MSNSNQSSTSPLPVHSSVPIHPQYTTVSGSNVSRLIKTPSKPSSPQPSSSSSKKKVQISPKKSENSIKLPERYELLGRFFDDMTSTIRQLQMKGNTRSFTNISSAIENLSDRKFSYSTHLAQMKYILPEAIELKKIVLVYQRKICTMSDLEVILVPDAIESVEKGKGESGYASLSKAFQIRLLEFHKTHPQEEEIPLGELPYPLNTKLQNAASSSNQSSTSPLLVHSSAAIHPRHTTVSDSNASGSFKPRMTLKVLFSESEKTQLSSTSIISSSQLDDAASLSRDIFPNLPTAPLSRIIPVGEEELELTNNDCLAREMLHSEKRLVTLTSTSKLCTDTRTRPDEIGDCSSEEIPAKLISSPARLMSATPYLQMSKRRHIYQGDASTPSIYKKIYDEVMEEEQRSREEATAISPEKKRRQMIARLPKLFDTINMIFQSKFSYIITKAELMHKILMSRVDISGRAEVEEQLELLNELVPDWVEQETNGIHCFCTDRCLCPDSVMRKLLEAIEGVTS
ncbi:hypothetical protein ACHQM5_026091 [Ranunculus cassubicifolius]